MIGNLSMMLRGQGIAILVNKYFGPRANAAMSVANTLNGQSSILTSAMTGAFSPAIITAYGAAEVDRARSLVFRSCKFGALFSLVFAIPLFLELDEVLLLWLKDPPAYTAQMTMIMLITHVIEVLTQGHMIAVSASGKIALYQTLMGLVSMFALPIAFILAHSGGRPYVAPLAILITVVVYTVVRVLLAKKIVGLEIRYWLLNVLIPIVVVTIVATMVGCLSVLIFERSFYRICITTFLAEATLLPFSWKMVCSEDERQYIRQRIMARLKR